MAVYLAHSAKDGHPAQSYEDHVRNVTRRAVQYAGEAEQYLRARPKSLKSIVSQSALFHDLGKLDDANQKVLRDDAHTHSHLPVNHVEAGTAAMLNREQVYAAYAIYSHHRGLPDYEAECGKGQTFLRDEHTDAREHTDKTLPELLRRHHEIFSPENRTMQEVFEGDPAVFLRMILSCLADADHTDTAAVYGQVPQQETLPTLRAKERLAALDRYVSALGGADDERSQLRREMYRSCRDAKITGGFAACDSPVGSGKTTAVMAHLLRQAADRGARRVFVILPYTSIIQQSVEVYREALVLPGEDPNQVVAELHCRADFPDEDTRYLTSLWRAPIVVTTAVTFFETLASNRPAALRRLHELPGSVIFVDEAHNALPLKLLPLAWKWLNILAEEWSCYWVLASGSLVRYWELSNLRQVEMPRPQVPDLVTSDLHTQLMQYETNRISFRWNATPLSRQELAEWVQAAPGPRLLILNTVRSAAVIADDLCAAYGREHVEHLSTALTPEDRSVTIERVKKRLRDKEDTDWTLVATSCVEAGVDFSFRTGFRELSSLLSLLQAAGRVNRHGKEANAEMWSFTLQDDSMLKSNSALDASRKVLKGYFSKGISPEPNLSTRSLNDEIAQDDGCIGEINAFIEQENALQFKAIDENFRVIDSDTVPAVVDASLAQAIAHGLGDWQALQKKSVSIRSGRERSWALKELATGIYQWTLGYDSFLGYMRGVLDLEKAKSGLLLF